MSINIRQLNEQEIDTVSGGPIFAAAIPIVKAFGSGVVAGAKAAAGSTTVRVAAGAGFTAGVAGSSAQGPRD